MPQAVENLKFWFGKRRPLDLYLITQCQDDSTENVVKEMLLQANISGLNPQVRIFFFIKNSSHLLFRGLPSIY
jgi:hypothetical protein